MAKKKNRQRSQASAPQGDESAEAAPVVWSWPKSPELLCAPRVDPLRRILRGPAEASIPDLRAWCEEAVGYIETEIGKYRRQDAKDVVAWGIANVASVQVRKLAEIELSRKIDPGKSRELKRSKALAALAAVIAWCDSRTTATAVESKLAKATRQQNVRSDGKSTIEGSKVTTPKLDCTGELIIDALGNSGIWEPHLRKQGKAISRLCKLPKMNSHFKATLAKLRNQLGLLENPGRGYYPSKAGKELYEKKVRTKSG